MARPLRFALAVALSCLACRVTPPDNRTGKPAQPPAPAVENSKLSHTDTDSTDRTPQPIDCEPEYSVFTIPEPDRPHSLELSVNGAFHYRVDHPKPERWEVLVTARGRHEDIVEHYGASMLDDGRVLYPAQVDRRHQALVVDGVRESFIASSVRTNFL